MPPTPQIPPLGRVAPSVGMTIECVIPSTATPRGGADTWDDMYRPPTQQARRLLHKG
jgi:hypothetical protein